MVEPRIERTDAVVGSRIVLRGIRRFDVEDEKVAIADRPDDSVRAEHLRDSRPHERSIIAAKRLGIAPTTARTHLQRLFAKTGTARQSELVRFVATYVEEAR